MATAHLLERTAWVDASAGVAGDMLLAALVDAGADRRAVRHAVRSVLAEQVTLGWDVVQRAGLRALQTRVDVGVEEHPHRAYPQIRRLLTDADLAAEVRDRAERTFARLADAEATVHGLSLDDVTFHEVGSWDSIADVVGVSAALVDLGVARVVVGDLAVGSGRVRTAHGELPVPVPAVVEMLEGWRVSAGGEGELATPTGVALLTALGDIQSPLPPMVLHAAGVGAGSRDVIGRANVVRVLVGVEPAAGVEPDAGAGIDTGTERLVELACNVDDLDPRVWPSVLESLLEVGAADAWLVPILMKKGRPAHTVHALVVPDRVPPLREQMLATTGTLGVRETVVTRAPLPRGWVSIDLDGDPLPVKIGYRDGVIVQASIEYEDAAALAAQRGRPVREVLGAAAAAADRAGLSPGRPRPSSLAGMPAEADRSPRPY